MSEQHVLTVEEAAKILRISRNSAYEAVKRGETTEPSFRRAADLQVVLDSCFESDRTGRRITL